MFAARLTEEMRGAIELEVGPVFIGCSIGITIVNDADLRPAEIVRQADFALYRTKETAKGQFCFFEPEMDAAIKMRRLLGGGPSHRPGRRQAPHGLPAAGQRTGYNGCRGPDALASS